MTRAQCIVQRSNRILMVRHCHDHKSWWCLPGGGIEPGETPADAALRELAEECQVRGVVVCQTSVVEFSAEDETITYLVDIGDQTPSLGHDPEALAGQQADVLCDVQWLTLAEIPERDRAFLWSAGLLGVGRFAAEVAAWGDALSYPL